MSRDRTLSDAGNAVQQRQRCKSVSLTMKTGICQFVTERLLQTSSKGVGTRKSFSRCLTHSCLRIARSSVPRNSYELLPRQRKLDNPELMEEFVICNCATLQKPAFFGNLTKSKDKFIKFIKFTQCVWSQIVSHISYSISNSIVLFHVARL